MPAAAFIGLSSLSLLWDRRRARGNIQLLFFLLPSPVAVVARAPLLRGRRERCGNARRPRVRVRRRGALPALDRKLYFARDLEVSNAYTSYLRTTSIFADASIYGRELAVAIVVLVSVLWLGPDEPLGCRGADRLPVGGAVLLVLAVEHGRARGAVLALGLVAGNSLDRRILVLGAVVLGVAAIAVTVVAVRGTRRRGRRVGGRR